MNSNLNISGLTPMSTVDYPNHLAAVLFTQGCPLRCGYCHNPHLIPSCNKSDQIEWCSVIEFLKKRVGFLQAVVFSGGEPTMQSVLPEAIKQVKDMGYKIGIHTSGIYPGKIEKILSDIDWIGLDVKALPENYERVTGRKGISANVDKTLKMINRSSIEHEIRITVHSLDVDVIGIQMLIDRMTSVGVKNCVIQLARMGDNLNEDYRFYENKIVYADLKNIVNHNREKFKSLTYR